MASFPPKSRKQPKRPGRKPRFYPVFVILGIAFSFYYAVRLVVAIVQPDAILWTKEHRRMERERLSGIRRREACLAFKRKHGVPCPKRLRKY